MTATIRALIVDDEPIARLGVRRQLEAAPAFAICGECGDGADAVRNIRALAPDVVFLDVQMPELDGLSVVRTIGAERMPLVVFVTAYDHYAVEAFELYALDYLVKPFDRERFRDCLRRVEERIVTRSLGDLPARFAALLAASDTPAKRLLVRDGERIVVVPFAGIDWLEAAGNYVRLHRGGESLLYRQTVDGMEQLLGPDFVRIRRSILVRADCIASLAPLFRGEYVVTLANGEQLRSSRRYRDRILAVGIA
jgi:two-component system LytT family response regulator